MISLSWVSKVYASGSHCYFPPGSQLDCTCGALHAYTASDKGEMSDVALQPQTCPLKIQSLGTHCATYCHILEHFQTQPSTPSLTTKMHLPSLLAR